MSSRPPTLELKPDLTLELLERQIQHLQRRFIALQHSVLTDFDLCLKISRANLSARCPASVRAEIDAELAQREKRRESERVAHFEDDEDDTVP